MAVLDRATEWASETAGLPDAWVRAVGLAVAGVLVGLLVHHLMYRWVIPLARRNRFTQGQIAQAIAGPLSWTFAFLGVALAARILFPDPARALLFERILTSGFLFIWGFALAGILAVVIRRGSRRFGRQRETGIALLTRVTKVLVAVVLALTLFSVWAVDVTPLLASAGLVGIALALAAQDTLANFFAGIAVYLDHPYEVGDWIVLEQGTDQQLDGEVVDVGLRSTRIFTRDGVLVTVPNSIIANARVVNESGHIPRYRLKLPVGVAYASDLELVERVLENVAMEHEEVLKDPAPRARVRAFGDSSIDWDLLAWIPNPKARPRIVHELAKTIHRRFREENITIPFPQRDVHLSGNAGDERGP